MNDSIPSLSVNISYPLPLERRWEPVTVGVPLPRSLCVDAAGWSLSSPTGEPLPLQTEVLERWSDGSIRWALLDFQVSAGLATSTTVTLRLGGDGFVSPSSIKVAKGLQSLEVDTGATRFAISARAPLLIEKAEPGAPGSSLLDGAACELRVVGGDGEAFQVRWHGLEVEQQGAVRVLVRAVGRAEGASGASLGLEARLHFHAGSGVVRLLLTARNPRRAKHPGGFWELGDPGSVLLRELALVLRGGAGLRCDRIRYALEPSHAPGEATDRVEVYQDSSGGENWAAPNHVNRQGVVPIRFRGYQAVVDGNDLRRHRATPVVVIEGTEGSLGVALPRFWQNFPRGLEAAPDAMVIGLFPAQWGDLHELQGGEQKTHECFLLFGADPVTDLPLDWCRHRAVACASPEWCAAAEAVPYLVPASKDPSLDYLELVNAAIDGPDSFFDKRERVDEYGWRHFGDIYGDHEAVFQEGPQPLVSHYNNQYDPVAGFACQFMRSGDPRWWTQCEELVAHVIDIDIYHTNEDKSAYNNGLFWHTVHYVDAGRSTHRTYPRANRSHGGGPSAEHNYPTGLMLYYFMTGNSIARETALALAQFVIDMDDGDKTVFRWLAGGHTGLATASGSSSYHGPGRGSGNSLNALVDGHRISGDRRFLAKAEQVIRRCSHPQQDLAELSLLDAENRWFYTMYLQALGKYLDHKIELDDLDVMYLYGREVLLSCARWMREREYPFLDKPEILEYPTETWAAQDMRKSEVFKFAAKHGFGAERELFMERAEFFFSYSIRTLSHLPTRTLARPVVLLLSNGFMHAYFKHNPDTSAPEPQEEWPLIGGPESFEPQKRRAMRRANTLVWLCGALGVALLGVVAAVFFQ